MEQNHINCVMPTDCWSPTSCQYYTEDSMSHCLGLIIYIDEVIRHGTIFLRLLTVMLTLKITFMNASTQMRIRKWEKQCPGGYEFSFIHQKDFLCLLTWEIGKRKIFFKVRFLLGCIWIFGRRHQHVKYIHLK